MPSHHDISSLKHKLNNFIGIIKKLINTIIYITDFQKIHPRKWIVGIFSYSRYIGYIRPHLLTNDDDEFKLRRQLLAAAWQPKILRAPVGRRLLALSPHSDDESIGAGGILLANRNLAQIHLVCLTDGAGGGDLGEETGGKSLVEVRREEFMKTAKCLNAASVHMLDFPDGNIPCEATAVSQLRALVREIQPDVVLLPWFLDGHKDHRRANILYARSCADIDAIVLGYEIWSMLEPNVFFDISEISDLKIDLISNYKSQLRTVDYVSYAVGLAKVRAYQASLNPRRSGAAEAFMALPNKDYCELISSLYGLTRDASES